MLHSKYLLRAHYAPGTILGPRDVALDKKLKFPVLMELAFYSKIMSLCTFGSAKNEFLKVEIRNHFLKSLKNVYKE